MTDPDFIASKLSVQTNASNVTRKGTNNRWHYQLIFDESIGWDWIVAQVQKVSAALNCVLELYKIYPSSEQSSFIVEVRELTRREGIDSGQHGLDSFE